jgi:hypothetical protein
MKLSGFLLSLALLLHLAGASFAAQVLIPMDESQQDHLKSYGMTYWVLQQRVEVDWLLNYRGGSFAFRHADVLEKELVARGISYTVLSDGEYQDILRQIADPEVNMEVMKLEKVPRIAVYTPNTAQPWDDAVMLVLAYAEIPFDKIFDDEVLAGKLSSYDWLHLHHEDFTGQYGKSLGGWNSMEWFQAMREEAEGIARKHKFSNVPEMKLAVVRKIKEYIAGGGFMFAMCSAADTYDIALAANGVDMVHELFDGDGIDPQAQQKLDFSQTLAFQDFEVYLEPYYREFSSIDNQRHERGIQPQHDYFQLFTFSAKWDPIPTMLTQNHEKTIKGFLGQTTAFKLQHVKPEVNVMGELREANEARYMNGTFGKGTWTFYGGHDPEEYVHMPGKQPTDLALYPNSPGYRLILNNVLFPAAKKIKAKT